MATLLLEAPTLGNRELSVIALIKEKNEHLRFPPGEVPPWYSSLYRTTFARNIRGSNSIEGHRVTLDDALAAVEGLGPFEASSVDWKAVQNYRDAMGYVMQLIQDAQFGYSPAVFGGLHYMMMRHDHFALPGLFRQGAAPGAGRRPAKQTNEDPESQEVPSLVQELADGLDRNEGVGPTMVHAAMTHLNIVMILPFKDGNGRMARAAQTLVLGRERIYSAQFSSIEEYLGTNRPAYYDSLAEVFAGRSNRRVDAHPWIRFVLVAHYRQSLTLRRRVGEAERLWEAIDEERRGSGLRERSMGSLHSAAMGLRVRRPRHIEYTGVSDRVATSDLKEMVDSGLLNAVGERRGRHYMASARLRRVHSRIQEARTPIPDPFEGVG